jgi:hypothetical protein
MIPRGVTLLILFFPLPIVGRAPVYQLQIFILCGDFGLTRVSGPNAVYALHRMADLARQNTLAPIDRTVVVRVQIPVLCNDCAVLCNDCAILCNVCVVLFEYRAVLFNDCALLCCPPSQNLVCLLPSSILSYFILFVRPVKFPCGLARSATSDHVSRC